MSLGEVSEQEGYDRLCYEQRSKEVAEVSTLP